MIHLNYKASMHGMLCLLVSSIFISGSLPLSGQKGKQNIKFTNISIKNGLSQSSPNCIFQDSRGIIWIGTEDGLNKYDGYGFTIYKPQQDVAFSLSNSRILSLAEDNAGNLWIGTNGGGLNKYDRKRDRFYAYEAKGKDSLFSAGAVINCIIQPSGKELWIGTNQGLALFNVESNSFSDLISAFPELRSLSGVPVNAIITDRNMIWIGTIQGLFRYDMTNKGLQQYLSNPFDDQSLPDNDITSLLAEEGGNILVGTRRGLSLLDINTEICSRIPISAQTNGSGYPGIKALLFDNDGDLWIATYAHGLYVGSLQTGSFVSYSYDHLNPYSLRNNEVLSLYKDFSGIIWVGTNGIDVYNPKKEKFVLYDYVPYVREQMVFRNIHPLYEDSYGVLWVGSKTDGLHRLNRKDKTYARYIHNPGVTDGLSSSKIRAIKEYPEGILWIGTEDAGLNKVTLDENRKPYRFKHFEHLADNPNSITSNKIYAFFSDDSGRLWIGTDNGLTIMDIERETFKQYLPDGKPGSISNNTVYAIYGDSRANVWLATDLGVNQYDPSSGGFIQFLHREGDKNSIIHNEILCFHEDNNGNLWIGTYGKGFDKFNPVDKTFTHFTQQQELATAVIYGILDDESGFLWMSTNNGILRFNEKTGDFKQFSIEDGLQSNEFNGTSYFRSNSGELFFGGQYGFNSFFPIDVKVDTIPPKIILSDLQVLNVSVVPGDHSPIVEHINEAREINLSYKQNNFTLYFSALHFANSALNRYKYKLEGFDKNWIDVGTKRFVSYTNLPYKNYTFRVIASNSDGVWNEDGLTVKVRIKPPLWATIWFRLLMGIAIAGAIAYIIRRRITADARQKKLLEEKFQNSSKELEEAQIQLEQQHAEIVVQKRELVQRQKDQENLLWFNQGLGLFSDLISKNRDDHKKLCHMVIEQLIQYIEAQQGGVFLFNDEGDTSQVLELVAHYAFSASRMDQHFQAGEGYVGTCFKDKEFIEIDNLPAEYTALNSGLGNLHLKHLILAPLKVNDQCIGVVEIGSFKKIKGYRISFIEKLMESFASTISTELANNRLKRVIDRSAAQAKELAENEEQLRLNLEEIMATQEESARRENELIKLAEESATREEMLNQEIEMLKRKIEQMTNQPSGN